MQHDDELDQILSREYQNLKKEVGQNITFDLTPEKVLARYKAGHFDQTIKKKKILSLDIFQRKGFQIAAPIAALLLIVVSFGIYKYDSKNNSTQVVLSDHKSNKEEKKPLAVPPAVAENQKAKPKKGKRVGNAINAVAQAEDDFAPQVAEAEKKVMAASKAENKDQGAKKVAEETLAMAKTSSLDEGKERMRKADKALGKKVSKKSLKKERKKLWKLIKKGKADAKTYARLETVLSQLKDKKGLKKLQKAKSRAEKANAF